MSGETTATPPVGGLIRDARNRRVLRYALGTTIALALATGIAWDLAYIAPYVVVFLLASPAPPPTVKKGLGYIVIVALACFVGLWSCQFCLDYPVVMLFVIGLALLRIFYSMASGGSPYLNLWLLIAILVIPLIAVQSTTAATYAVEGMVIGSAATMLSIWSAFLLVPEPPVRGTASASLQESPAARTCFETAVTTTIVVMPMVVFFHLSAWVDGVLALGYTGFLATTPAFTKGLKAGKALILANLAGGAAAILMFGILTVVPEFSYLLLLILMTGLYFGSWVMSDHPMASLIGRVFATLVLVIVSATTSSDGSAASEVYHRVLQIMTAVIYVVVVSTLVGRLKKARTV